MAAHRGHYLSADTDEMLADLRAGVRVSDTRFDKLFPDDDRQHARVHWTPVAVAIEVARWFTETSGLESGADSHTSKFRVLDVGSNVGKFCVIGALSTKAQFTGVERRRRLVDIARTTARELRVERVRYLCADMETINWSEFGGIYMYNPFFENIEPQVHIDREVPLSPALYQNFLAVTQKKLQSCLPGTRVATFYGFGGEFPAGFEKIAPSEGLLDRLEPILNERLEFWVKR